MKAKDKDRLLVDNAYATGWADGFRDAARIEREDCAKMVNDKAWEMLDSKPKWVGETWSINVNDVFRLLKELADDISKRGNG